MTSTTASTTASATSSVTTVELTPVVGDELYLRYPQQTRPQDVFVQLDCENRKLSAAPRGGIGDGTPYRVYNGHVRRWRIPALNANAANMLLAEIVPLAELLCAEWSEVYDGSNHVGLLTEKGQFIADQIGELCERCDDPTDQIQVWDAGDWYAGIGGRAAQRAALGIEAATTDEQLDEIEDKEAHYDGVDVIEGLAKYLLWLRNEARAEAAEAARLATKETECSWEDCDAQSTTVDRDGDQCCAEHAFRSIGTAGL